MLIKPEVAPVQPLTKFCTGKKKVAKCDILDKVCSLRSS